MANFKNLNEKEKYDLLVEKLIKECTNSRDYLGVEYDNIQEQDNETMCELLFGKVFDEMITLAGNAGEFVEDEFTKEYGEYKPFKSYKNVDQHISRLRKFIKKYAPKVLEEDKVNEIVKYADKY